MNERLRQLAEQAGFDKHHAEYDTCIRQFAQLLLANLAEELSDVAQRSKQTNPEWANGIDHAAMLAQRMTMNLPQWPEAE
jgi:hypothetical protein